MTTATPHESREAPCVDILFLGSPGVGKTTFLAQLPYVQHPSVAKNEASDRAESAARAAASVLNASTRIESPGSSSQSLPAHSEPLPPPYSSTNSLPIQTRQDSRPLSGPLIFKVSLFARPYTMTIHPSTSQLFTDPFPTTPQFVIICFAVNSRASLHNAQHYWLTQFHMHYPASSAPVMLLGLQRDLRTAERDEQGRVVCVMPEEGLEAAREMRCDRYAECSARTGELMWEVVEDITRAAAKTTLGNDYASDMCTVM